MAYLDGFYIELGLKISHAMLYIHADILRDKSTSMIFLKMNSIFSISIKNKYYFFEFFFLDGGVEITKNQT